MTQKKELQPLPCLICRVMEGGKREVSTAMDSLASS